LVVLWWALLAFVASGFEHSVANMTVFALGALQGTSTWMDLAKNLVWTVPGNIVGGGLVIGLGYAWLARVSPTMGQGVVGAESEVPHPAAA
jgi:nitrite transporter